MPWTHSDSEYILREDTEWGDTNLDILLLMHQPLEYKSDPDCPLDTVLHFDTNAFALLDGQRAS